MANVGRKLGVNIRTCMQEANISLDSFAKHLGIQLKMCGMLSKERL